MCIFIGDELQHTTTQEEVEKFSIGARHRTIMAIPSLFSFHLLLASFVLLLHITLSEATENIAAFYHTSLTEDGRHIGIIKSQIQQLNTSGLLSRLNAVYYGTFLDIIKFLFLLGHNEPTRKSKY